MITHVASSCGARNALTSGLANDNTTGTQKKNMNRWPMFANATAPTGTL